MRDQGVSSTTGDVSVGRTYMSAVKQAVQSSSLGSGAALVMLPVFCTTLFLSAFLLFSVQPMFAKLVLPELGGSPAVWSVAMVFFQMTLLAGYAYAHVIATRLTSRWAAFVHLSILGLALALALPIDLVSGFSRPIEDGQALWLIGVFAMSVGLPFFAVSANGPLLQAWFARTEHPHAADPYFLYCASNIGSLLALLSYPFAIEPSLSLTDQGLIWTWGFALLIVGVVAAAGVSMSHSTPARANRSATTIEYASAPSWSDRLQWTVFAFVPSALLVAVTAFISMDVAAAPLLWVVPLALFLLSFIIVFQRKPILPHGRMQSLQLIIVGFLLAPDMIGISLPWKVTLPLHLAGFFLTAMVCHGEMARRRPGARHLTEFYLWMSFGGVLGGLSAALVAPHLFSTVIEYPLLLVASILCHTGLFEVGNRTRTVRTIALWITVGGIAALLLHAMRGPLSLRDFGGPAVVLITLSLVLMLQFKHPSRLVGLCAAAFLVMIPIREGDPEFDAIRSFYGVHRIGMTSDGQFRTLSHGTTLHGAQRIRDGSGRLLDGPPEAITYYHTSGNISQAIEAIRAAQGRLTNVAVVGVGTGSLACRKQVDEHWTFYEIDRAVIRIAKDPSRFSFMSSCAPDVPIVLGDARLTLSDARNGSIDLLIIDAFSSDAIPVHLMTREAAELYVSKLSARGSIVFHISNRNMELASVVAAVGRANGLTVFRGAPEHKANIVQYIVPSEVAVLSRSAADVGDLLSRPGWERYDADWETEPWTDDYADVTGAIWRRLRSN